MSSYIDRRDNLAEKMEPKSIALVYSGDNVYRVGDETYPFEVNRDFYYLTGIERPKMILMIWKNVEGDIGEYLFIERYDEEMARWVGGKMKPEEASRISGVDPSGIRYLDEFEDTIGMYLSRYGTYGLTLYPDLHKEEVGEEDGWLVKETRRLQRHYPDLKVVSCYTYIAELRLVKDESEIKELKKGIAITKRALELVWKNLKPGMNESEVEAWFDYELKKERAGHSFESIFASGQHSTTLHYSQNNSIIPENSVLLTDLGATSHYYCADISRTVPTSGKYTPRQKEIYNVVLACNRHIIDYARPGMTLRQLNEESIRFYKKELPKHGLLKNGHTLFEYYFHSIGHMLGLQCHDVDIPGYKLRNGNVFTVEPGLYIEEEGFGVRIEDNVVLRNGRAEVLSKDILKDPDEIEAFFANR